MLDGRILPLVVGCCFAGAAPTLAQPATAPLGTKDVTLWEPYAEWSLTYDGAPANPYDVQATATFTHQSTGETRTTGMFYDGGDTWKFRFTGTQAGTWDIQTSGPGDLGGRTGQINAQPNPDPRARGFMKTIPHEQGARWGWSGTGEAFVPQWVMGKDLDTYTDNGQVDTARIDADLDEFMDGHGFTGFHFQTNGDWFDGDNPDPLKYEVLETVIRKTHERGGSTHIWLWGTDAWNAGTGPSQVGGHLSETDRRNQRYLAARLGPLPGWSMGFGFDAEDADRQPWIDADELDDWKAFLEGEMGWDHFLGARTVATYEDEPSDELARWLGGDYTGYTSYRPMYEQYVQVMGHRPDLPSFEEDRFRIRESDQFGPKDYTPEMTRRSLWNSAMAGGVANIWGNLLPHNDNARGSEPYDNQAEGAVRGNEFTVDIKHQIQAYALFFEDRFHADLQRANQLSEGEALVLRHPGNTHFLFYIEDADSIVLDLTGMDGEQPVIAIDTTKPYEEIDLGTLGPGRHTHEFDYRSDWAIAVGRAPDPRAVRRGAARHRHAHVPRPQPIG